MSTNHINSQLNEIFTKHGSDKATKHHYHLIYEAEFDSVREQPLTILEVGVFKGESTAAWVEYFPHAKIYGLDVFTRVPMNQIAILNHPRVSAMRGDSTDITVTEQIRKHWPGIKFDIIIDDGLHTPRANADTFRNLFPLLKEGGSYYIEDAWPLHKMSMSEMNHPWIQKYPDRYNALEMEYFLRAVEDYNVRWFDTRKLSGQPDSYIFKVTHD